MMKWCRLNNVRTLECKTISDTIDSYTHRVLFWQLLKVNPNNICIGIGNIIMFIHKSKYCWFSAVEIDFDFTIAQIAYFKYCQDKTRQGLHTDILLHLLHFLCLLQNKIVKQQRRNSHVFVRYSENFHGNKKIIIRCTSLEIINF